MLSSRIGVRDDAGHIVGWACWNSMGRFSEIANGIWCPDDFALQCPGGPDQPSLLMKSQVREGVVLCVGVAVESRDDGRRTTPRDLNLIAYKLNNWQEIVCRSVMQPGRRLSATEPVVELRRLDDAVGRRAYGETLKKDRTKLTDAMLEEIAAIYRDADKGAAWQSIQDHFGVSASTAGRYIMRARKEGHLPQTTRGKRS
jgi:hypothetical protein